MLHCQCLVGVAMNYYPPWLAQALYILHVRYVCRSDHKIKAMLVISACCTIPRAKTWRENGLRNASH